MKAKPSLLRGPRVSTATGMKMYRLCSSVYFACFLVAAISAAAYASAAVPVMYEAATVSTTIASHMRALPLHHGIRVWPSGLLPSALVRPDGSLTAGIFRGPVEAAEDEVVD